MALRFNSNWGIRPGCFPSTSESFTSGNTVKGHPPGDASNAGQEIARRWTPAVYSQLTEVDRKDLQGLATGLTERLKELKSHGNVTTTKFDRVISEMGPTNGKLTADVNVAWTQASAALTDLITQKTQTFTDLDKLMVYAPDANTAQRLCAKKINAENSLKESYNKITEASKAINNKFSEFYKKREEWLAGLQALFAGFIDALTLLINILQQAFKLQLGILIWAKNNPKTSAAIGGTLALLIVGLILRPYVTIISSLSSRRKSKNR